MPQFNLNKALWGFISGVLSQGFLPQGFYLRVFFSGVFSQGFYLSVFSSRGFVSGVLSQGFLSQGFLSQGFSSQWFYLRGFTSGVLSQVFYLRVFYLRGFHLSGFISGVVGTLGLATFCSILALEEGSGLRRIKIIIKYHHQE